MHQNIRIWLSLASICTVVKSYSLGQKQNCRYKTFDRFQLIQEKFAILRL